MAPKRKSPERKKPARRAPGIVARTASALAATVARHPMAAGGAVCFVIVFGFVAANALWYQPGRHPSPYLRTRDITDFFALTGVNRNPMLERDPAEVVTYRIEREPVAGEAPAPTDATGGSAAATTPGEQETSALTMAIQRELKRRGFYSGVEDGLPGPMTRVAILTFQKSVGMEETGESSPELLAALQVDTGATAAVPRSRPVEDLDTPEAAIDPVAAAIRSAEQTVVTAPAAPAPRSPSKPVGRAPQAAVQTGDAATIVEQANLVMQIQRGLSNIAYADVGVDGVAGEQTRAAIRHFERHYRLPETGQPNEAVLKKLKSIGAL